MRLVPTRETLVLVGMGIWLGGCARKVVKSGSASPRQRIVQVARSYLGTPYRYGGCDRQGMDCSGFVWRTYQEAVGLQLPRTAEAQAQQGRRVPLDKIRPGDLVFFREPKRKKVAHVGIVVGRDGRFVHASTSKGVREDRLDDPYWRARVVEARRLLSEGADAHTDLPAKKATSRPGTAKKHANGDS